MQEVATVLTLLLLVTFLAIATRRSTIPYPTVMVLAGLVIALIPGLPAISISPDVVFLMFLPPLLYAAAWQMPWRDFKQNIRPISLLALGLVFLTTLVVGLAAKYLWPEMPWPVCFALGAIVSPPDAIAATSMTKVLPIPRRVVVILEGESLINDASGLVTYRVAVAAALGGAASFSVTSFALEFLIASVGGVAIGWLGGWIATQVHRRIDDPLIETILTLLTPFAVYLPCEALHVSGVLAVVTTGLFVRQRAHWLFSSATRLHANSVWECVLFVLNGLTFIFIGLELRDIVQTISDKPLWWSSLAAVGILLVTMLIRIAYVFPAAILPRLLIPKLAGRDPMPPYSHLTIIAWTGMRGMVSLAAALALPKDFPFRDLLLFVAFVVILGTLVFQSLTLPWLIRKLKISMTDRSHEEQELDARLSILAVANTYLEGNSQATEKGHRDVEYLKSHFDNQARRLVAKLSLDVEEYADEPTTRGAACNSLHFGALESQRARLRELQHDGLVNEEVAAKLEREIYLEEIRLKLLD